MEVAFTEIAPQYPGYLNLTRLEDGSVVVTVRASPTKRHGVYVCAHARDAGPGRCVPGGPSCNNYCNMHPDKSKPMADSPLDCEHTDCGASASFTMPAEAWSAIVARLPELA